MILDCVTVGDMGVNCYLVGDANELIIIDPGDDAAHIIEHIEDNGYGVRYVVLTHCHFDHIGAVWEVCQRTGARLLIGEKEADNYADRKVTLCGYFSSMPKMKEPDAYLAEGDVVQSGNFAFRVLETPGHTSGSICLLCEDCLLSGDTLFRGSIGRADFPTGDLRTLIASITDKLFTLPDYTKVYPGHGESSTIGYEKEHNEVYEWERRSCESMGRSS